MYIVINVHCHTDYSNIRLLDCINSVKELIEGAVKVGYKGIAITDHESLSAHVKALEVVEKLKKDNKIPQDFKLILGNEPYLVDSITDVRDNYVGGGKTKFPHYILLAKNLEGHKQLRILSSHAWSNSFFTGMMERVPLEKSYLEEIIKPNQGNVIGSTACLGSELGTYLIRLQRAMNEDNQERVIELKTSIDKFIKWNIEVFGKSNFFLEIQPALQSKEDYKNGIEAEQTFANKMIIKLSKAYDLSCIVTTDAHYLRPEDRDIHRAFLNAKDGEREVDDFYEACFLQTEDEIRERLWYLDEEDVDSVINNTDLLGEMIGGYDIRNETTIPKIDIPKFELSHMFKPAYDKYEYIKEMAYSDDEQNVYLLKLIEEGFNERIPKNVLTKERFHQILARINVELGELWEISKTINQAMASYYVTVKEIVDVIWDKGNSLVGSGRGSASGFIINFLLGITQINPLDYEIEIPHWRHLHKSRPDVGALDIDLDTEGNKRPQIMKALKDHFGDNRILQVCTFGTEGSKSALQTACRGLGISVDISQYLSGMIPFERGSNWKLSDCFFGDKEKERKPIKEFIREVEKYPLLKETALRLEGKINKRSIHAGGVILFNEDYYETSALMKAPNGLPITQFNLDDCQAIGSVKFDLLTIEALDKIRATLDMLIKHKEMEWQGTLRGTFDKYLHPDVIDKTNPRIYEMLGTGEVMDLFQFSTDIGHQSVTKVKPNNLVEMSATNSLMRLMSDGEEQPVDTFIKYKNNINLWYKEMGNYGLNQEEIEVMKEHFLKLNGVADTQESVMIVSMDERVANFSISEANKLRKSIAKRSPEVLKEVHELFFKKGREQGTSDSLLNYVWEVQIKRMLGYAFSANHVVPYSLIALQELNLNYKHNPLYWSTACLSVNAGSSDENSNDGQSTNYGKIAYAIGNIQRNGVKMGLPSINRAGFGFTPDIENNQIVFGLKAINGIGDEVAHHIIENRPYHSFEDFIERMYDTSIIKKSQMLQLIKAGCFEEFIDRKTAMSNFINLISDLKQKITMQNIPMLIENELMPEELNLQERLFKFRKYVLKNVHKTVSNPKDKWLKLDDLSQPFFEKFFSEDCIVDYDDNSVIISDKKFKKEYDELMKPVKDWVSTDEALLSLNNKLYENCWQSNAEGNQSKWEMDALSFYYTEHELENVDKEKYGLVDFYELSQVPEIVKTFEWRGRKINEYKIERIVGTVLDKDKNKHTVTILSPSGVVVLKYYSGQFGFYNRQISEVTDGTKTVVEKSWFQRGNKLLISGFRRGSNFIPKVYKDSIYQKSTCLITNVHEDGNLSIQSERAEV